MVPGGVFSIPSSREIFHCLYLLKQFRKWYEGRVLGCGIEKWLALETKADLMAWLEEKKRHADGDAGFFIRFALENGLDKLGRGCGNFISYGVEGTDQPDNAAGPSAPWSKLAGILINGAALALDQQNIAEDAPMPGSQQGHARSPLQGANRPLRQRQ